jgi:hypothetical protein
MTETPNQPLDSAPGPITDSPWFWVSIFCAMALVALVVMERKYGERQAGIERQYQAREYIHRQQDGGERTGEVPEYSQPGQTIIPLWPLRIAMIVAFLAAWAILLRQRLGRYVK